MDSWRRFPDINHKLGTQFTRVLSSLPLCQGCGHCSVGVCLRSGQPTPPAGSLSETSDGLRRTMPAPRPAQYATTLPDTGVRACFQADRHSQSPSDLAPASQPGSRWSPTATLICSTHSMHHDRGHARSEPTAVTPGHATPSPARGEGARSRGLRPRLWYRWVVATVVLHVRPPTVRGSRRWNASRRIPQSAAALRGSGSSPLMASSSRRSMPQQSSRQTKTSSSRNPSPHQAALVVIPAESSRDGARAVGSAHTQARTSRSWCSGSPCGPRHRQMPRAGDRHFECQDDDFWRRRK